MILFSLGVEVSGRPDIIIDLTSPGALEKLDKQPFTIKEGADFRMKARFRVQHQILSGLKYVQVVSRMGLKNKMQEMIVRFFPFFLSSSLAARGLVCWMWMLTAVCERGRTPRTRAISRSMRRSVSIRLTLPSVISGRADWKPSRERDSTFGYDGTRPLRRGF